MRILVIALGSDGDVNPMLKIAEELKSRGHDIHFFANEYFKKKSEQAGFSHVNLGTEAQYHEVIKNKDLWEPRKGFQTVWSAMKDYLLDQYQVLEERYIPNQTAIVGTSLAFAARMMQEKYSVKYTSVHLQPSLILSSEKPPYMPGFSIPEWFPLPMKKLVMSMIDELVLDKVVKEDLNSIRTKLELDPVKNVMTKWIHSPDQVLFTFPEWFAEPQKDWPENISFSGFPVFTSDASQSVSKATQNFIDSGQAPIVFTAGSANAHSSAFFEAALKSTKNLNMRAIFVSKFNYDIPKDLPDYLLHSTYEPFDLLFPQAKMVVHHGGIGTSAQALHAATPQMIVPFAHDQFDNADRLEQLHVGLHAKSTKVDEWTSHLNRLANDSSFKDESNKKAELMKKSKPATQIAADCIESLGT